MTTSKRIVVVSNEGMKMFFKEKGNRYAFIFRSDFDKNPDTALITRVSKKEMQDFINRFDEITWFNCIKYFSRSTKKNVIVIVK